MKRFALGMIWGLVMGLGTGVALLLYTLPAPPSSYRQAYPFATSSIPREVTDNIPNGIIGFDIYKGPKPNRFINKEMEIPFKKSTGWLASSGQDGTLRIYETFWAEYGGQLYKLVHFTNTYLTTPNRNMSMLKVFEAFPNRTFTVRVLIPDIELDETYGPFDLPKRKDAEHAPPAGRGEASHP